MRLSVFDKATLFVCALTIGYVVLAVLEYVTRSSLPFGEGG